MVLRGFAQVAHAVQARSWGRTLLLILLRALYTLAGLFLLSNPVLASSMLTLILAIALITVGLVRIVVGIGTRPLQGWGWIVASAVLTLLAGLVVISGWPVNSLWILGLLLAVELMFQGWAWLAVGLALGRS